MGMEGAKVVLADVQHALATDKAQELQQAGIEALAVDCDVSSKTQVDRMIDQAVERFGGVDILVANAGRRWHAAASRTTPNDGNGNDG